MTPETAPCTFDSKLSNHALELTLFKLGHPCHETIHPMPFPRLSGTIGELSMKRLRHEIKLNDVQVNLWLAVCQRLSQGYRTYIYMIYNHNLPQPQHFASFRSYRGFSGVAACNPSLVGFDSVSLDNSLVLDECINRMPSEPAPGACRKCCPSGLTVPLTNTYPGKGLS